MQVFVLVLALVLALVPTPAYVLLLVLCCVGFCQPPWAPLTRAHGSPSLDPEQTTSCQENR